MRSISAFSAERLGSKVREIPTFPIPHGGGIQALRALETNTRDTAIQAFFGSLNISEPLVNFDGISNADLVLPPDPIGDVGPDHYVQMINTSFAIYDKSGGLLYGPASINLLFSGVGGVCETTNRGDPVVLYDDLANRWLMSAFAFDDTGGPDYDPSGPYHQCIAISASSDPLGSWYRYDFILSNTKLNDYAKFGVWSDGYYLAVNQYTQPTFTWGGQGVAVFERDKMLVGESAQMVYFDMYGVDPTLGAMLPSDADGTAPPANTPNYYVQFDDDAWGYSPDQLRVWEFDVNWDTPGNSTFTEQGSLTTFAFDSNLCNYARDCIPQKGTTQGVDAISDRLMYRLQYRNFGSHASMVLNHTVDVGSDVAGIRWYELRDTGSGWSIYQQGTYSPDSTNRWMGSIAMDDLGNIALGYSASTSALYPSIRYTGRFASDPLGTMTFSEETLYSGGGSQTSSSARWGDYSMMAVDPEDNCTFWYTNEYYGSTSEYSFRTRIGNFKFGDCDPFESGWLNLGDNGHGDGPLQNSDSIPIAVEDILVDEDGNIYVAGKFVNAGGVAEADYIAKWNGSAWEALGNNGAGDGAFNLGPINDIITDNDGNLIVAGNFRLSGDSDPLTIAMWDGNTWSGHAINSYFGEIETMAWGPDGNLYVGGLFHNAFGDPEADFLMMWDGVDWSPVGPVGGDGALTGRVYALAFDSAGNLYVGGAFGDAGGNPEADHIAMWDGESWVNLGCCNHTSVVDSTVYSIIVDDSDQVYIGGRFKNVAGNLAADSVAMWDGTQWNNLGDNGSGNGAIGGEVFELEFNGSYLFVAGSFTAASEPKASRLAVWNGSTWGYVSEEPSGNSPFADNATFVKAIGFSTGGIGVEGTIAGGNFENLDGNILADHIAYYEGTTFADVPEHDSFYPYIQALWDAGFTAGCQTNPLLFCPDTILDRAQSGVFILRGQLGTGYTPPGEPWDTFQDDWSGSDISWAEKWAEGMWEEGLTAGCQNSPELLYCPRSLLPRVEAAVFGLRLLHGSSYVPPDASGTLFADMTDTGYWGTKWAEQAYLDGLLPACGFTSTQPLFCPDDEMSRAWAAYMIVVAKDLPLP